MRRATTILFAVLASLMLVSVAPAASMNATMQSADYVVGSQHTDFGTGDESAPQTLENLTTTGSGDTAAVELESSTPAFSDGFEDEAADAGVPDDWETVSTFDTQNVTTQAAAAGSQSYYVENVQGGSNVGESRPATQPSSPTTENVSTSLYSLEIGNDEQVMVSLFEDGTRVTMVGMRNGDLQYYDGSAWTTISTQPDNDQWVDISLYAVDPSTDTFGVAWETPGASASTSGLTFETDVVNGYEETRLRVYDGKGYVDDFQIGSGTIPESAKYLSAVHDISNAEEAAINIEQAVNTSYRVNIQADTGSGFDTIKYADFSTAGNKTVNVPDGYDQYRIKIDVDVTDSNPSWVLADESILFNPHSPQASGFTPANNSMLESSSTEFSVDVTDADFPTAQGDEVTAELFVNGEPAGSETVTSNSTVSVTEDLAEGGENTYHWELTDSYGETTTTETKTVNVPAELSIYDESNGSELVDNATVELQFYYQGDPELVVERNTSDGTIDMDGLPADRSFVVVADAEGYLPRRIYVPSLYEQQSVYLLNESKEHVNPSFVLEDYTGRYGQETTVLLIQRAINGSWQTVQGDYFGATGSFPAQLRYNTRHRLILLNTETGERRNLGAETPLRSGEFIIEVRSDDEIEVQRGGPAITVNPGTRTLAAVNGSSVDITLDDQSIELDSWSAAAYYRNATVNESLYSETFDGPNGGTTSPTFDLSNRSGGNVTVVVEYETSSGRVDSKQIVYSIRSQYENEYSLLDTLLSMNTLVPDSNWGMLTTFLSVLLSAIFTTMVGGAVRASTELLGLVALLSLSAFAVIGWLGYSVVFATGVAWVSLTAVRRGY